MKKLLLASFLFCYCYIVAAQHPYIPIPKDSAIWISLEYNKSIMKPTRYYVARMEGVDTVVNGKTYNCYFGEWPNTYLPMPAPKTTAAYFAEWIREDTIAKKVWYYASKGPYKEVMLYDFSLQKGDTLTDSVSAYFAPQDLYPYKAWVADVDSIFWSDGLWRYRWWINGNINFGDTLQVIMIEGMGYTANFLDDPKLQYDGWSKLYREVTCFNAKGTWLYETNNPWNADCDTMISRNVTVSVPELMADLDKPLLYPNPAPANGNIYLNKNLPDVALKAEAYNLYGQKVLEQFVKPGESVPLAEHNIMPGLYIFRLRDQNNSVLASEKVLII